MQKYRKVPWKRNLKQVPAAILQKIQNLPTDAFVVRCVKTLRAADVAGVYAHLSPPGEMDEASEVMPATDMGRFSSRNSDGWTEKREDLPKITKTFYWESPNFGDASRYGTHVHYRDREVYQTEYHEPRFYKIETRLLKMAAGSASGGIYQMTVNQPLLRTQSGFENELLFMLNLLQENCGEVDVFSESASTGDIIATLSLDWDVFPPGKNDDIVGRLTSGRQLSSSKAGIVADRVKLFALLKPQAYLKGRGAFGNYIGARYADDLVVFENMDYGNALYVLYDDWADVSKRSRLDLIRGTDANFDRLVHTIGWEKAFGKIMAREKKKRGLV